MQRTQPSWGVETTSILDHAGARLSEARMLIIDDDRLFAEALQLTLIRAGLGHVEAICDGLDDVECAQWGSFDVVLLDLGLSAENGLTLGRSIIELSPDAKVIALTGTDDPATVEEALRLGFHGYITKNTKLSQFVSSVRRAFEGHVVVAAPTSSSGLLGPAIASPGATLLAKHLTPRERDVLQLLVQGATGHQIASELKITPNTVRTHVQSILVRLQVHSRLEAVVFAVDHGVVPTQRHAEEGAEVAAARR